MQKLIIEGGNKIRGEIAVQGAKNSVLPILAGAVMVKGNTELRNCPKLTDVFAACRILSCLGIKTSIDKNTISIHSSRSINNEIPDRLMREMRSSIIFLGAVLGEKGECILSFPGGCELGPRPINMHLSALRKMGVTIKEEYGCIKCIAGNGISGAKIPLEFPSVGATENIILAAVKANGDTIIQNAAREPEITDLACFLNKCGAKIRGAGESTICISGVNELYGCEYSIMPDRIAVATYIAAAAATGGEIMLTGARFCDAESFTSVFEQMGCHIYSYADRIYANAKKPLKAVKTIRTMPYPGFPTDVQSIAMAMLCKAEGTSVFVENIFDNRFKQVDELIRMGADIKVEGKVAIIEGVKKLYGAKVAASDLRGGAALVIAGLSAEGITEISDIKHIDRGYEAIENAISSLGGKISRI